MSFIPSTSQTALTAPRAIIPVPLGAALNFILPAPSLPYISWCIVLPSLNGICTRFLRANSFGFSALVVVGNQNGKIGVAHAKAKQVPDAIKKANELARRNLVQIPLREGRTIHHDIYGKDGAGKIKLRAAPKGTGIIARGAVRAVCEVLGIKDIVAKSLGTANPHNVIRACMKALSKQNSPKNISLIRNKKISEIIEKRG
jgi:small subunit ribosomal protein S5